MKKAIKTAIICGLLACPVALVGCQNDTHTPQTSDVVVIDVDSYQIVIGDSAVEDYDWTRLFGLTVNGESITVSPDYIDASSVKAQAGRYSVTITYGDKTETIEVIVTSDVNTLTFTDDVENGTISIADEDVEGHDFKQYFVAVENGFEVDIPDGAVKSNVKPEPGTYTYEITFLKTTLVLNVNVVETVRIVASYHAPQISVTALESYDYTKLFSLYESGRPVRVTSDMVDATALRDLNAGEKGNVIFTYTRKGKPYTRTVEVTVVADSQLAVNSRNIEIYPHSGDIDPTTLFEIKRGDVAIPVTADMITGEIDYSSDGETDTVSTLTLDYGGHKYTATVTVKTGVVIGYRSGEIVEITSGTEKTDYDFAADFVLTINGVRFVPTSTDLDSEQLGSVDFDKKGDYPVTLTVKYNSSPLVDGSADFTEYRKTITYRVVERTGRAWVKNPNVVLKSGTKTYNPLGNISAIANGYNQGFTTDREQAENDKSGLTTYVDVLSDSIDFKSAAEQTVRLAVYVAGLSEAPTTLEFTVRIDGAVKIDARDAGVFIGSTIYTTDLFEITDEDGTVAVTEEMVGGKIDVFACGVYPVTCTYRGLTVTANVTVFDDEYIGTYSTLMTKLPVEDDDDDEYEEGWGGGEDDWYGDGYYAARKNAERSNDVSAIGDFVIRQSGNATVDGNAAQIIGSDDNGVMLIRVGSNKYAAHIADGIAVLDPDNSVKLGFSDYRRPLVYFDNSVWRLNNRLVVNYGSDYVLNTSYVSYSIDVFEITNIATKQKKYYALKTHLVEKSSADTVYRLSWGYAEISDGYTGAVGDKATLTFDGERYAFTVMSEGIAKVDKKSDFVRTKFDGYTYLGRDNGVAASLKVEYPNKFRYTVGGSVLFEFFNNDMNNYKNSYVDEQNDTVLLYRHTDTDYIFSYKFKLDASQKTLEVLPRDKYYGRYESDKVMIFLDGYGTGHIHFDKKSFISTSIRYTVEKGIVKITYVGTTPTFAYGTDAEFYIGDTLNTLIVKRFDGDVLTAGTVLESIVIADGALVELGKTDFTASETAKDAILSAIKIKTPNGSMSAAEIKQAVDLSAVDGNTAGYYRIAVDIPLKNSEHIVTYYTVRIVE